MRAGQWAEDLLVRNVKGEVDVFATREHMPHSDLEAARMIAALVGGEVTYVVQQKEWLRWNGVYLQSEATLMPVVVHEYADSMAAAMNAVKEVYKAEAAQMSKDEANKHMELYRGVWEKHRRYRNSLFNVARQRSLLTQLESVCSMDGSLLGKDARWLVAQNGVLDLDEIRDTKQVVLHEHDPQRNVTRALSCDYDPSAQAPRWRAFLASSLPDEDLRLFLQRMVGAAFLAETKVKALPNLVGDANCGKTVFLRTLVALAGDGAYGIEASDDALMQVSGQNWEQETLRGKRFIAVSDPSSAKKLDDSFVKRFTGGDGIRTRGMYSLSTTWDPQGMIFVASNTAVRFNTGDKALLDRICIVKFPHAFIAPEVAEPGEPHVMDRNLERDLLKELPGILNWVIEGMLMYLQRGIDRPASVIRSGRDVETDGSPALTWLQEQIEDGNLVEDETVGEAAKSHYVKTSDLWQRYVSSCARDYEKPMKQREFFRHIASRYDIEASGGRRVLRLRAVARQPIA